MVAIRVDQYAHCQPKYPVTHVEKVPFTPRVRVPHDYSERTTELRRLDFELDRFILNVRDYVELVADAYASNVHYSTELEGNPLALPEVQKLTRDSFHGDEALAPDAPRQEIVNHLATWLAPETYRLPWTEVTIRGVHRFLTEGVETDGVPGAFRTTMTPITQDGDVVFAPARPERISTQLEALLHWLNEESQAYHPLAAATVFFHEFESIHPFREGNGRTGRTLFHLLLQLQGLKNANLCKIETELLHDAELYYRLLSWTDERGDYHDLIDYVLQRTLSAYRRANEEFASKDLLSSGMDEHSKRLLTRAKSHKDWFSVADASAWVDDIGDATIRRRLNALVDIQVLETKGQTRGKRYRFADPFMTLRANVRKVAQRAHQTTLTP